MIISHSKKLCFWKIPRTGSTTIELLFRLFADLDFNQDIIAKGHFFPQSYNFDMMPDSPTGVAGERRTHITPQEAIDNNVLTLAQYNSYQNFIMVRDPVLKFVSAYNFATRHRDFDAARLIADTVIPAESHQGLFKKQVEWLTLGNITMLPFSDYVNSLTTVMTAFGATMPTDIPSITRRHPHVEEEIAARATPADETAIRAYYSEDNALNF